MSLSTDLAVPDAAPLLARGVSRLLSEMGYACLTELRLRSGRRVDVVGLDGRGKLVVVEIKRSVADFRSDAKWPEYLEFCDSFYFAVPEGFPLDILPDDTGLMLADRFGAEIMRAAPANPPLHASRRREVTIRFAQAAANRLQAVVDPPV